MTYYPDEVEIPDTSFETLDRAAERLCKADLVDLTPEQHADLDLILAQLLLAIYHRADMIADLSLIPGKVADSVLEKHIVGYKEARELSEFVLKHLTDKSEKA